MRNLEDCRAEVFRRSEKRIKERKRKRNCALAWCIPLCLLLVAGGIYIRPLFEPVDECAKAGGTNRILDGGVGVGGYDYTLLSKNMKYTSVEITDRTGDTEVVREVTDEVLVGSLCSFMMTNRNLLATAESTTDGKETNTIKDEVATKDNFEGKTAEYEFVFQSETGETSTFRLYESTLYHVENNRVVILSKAQVIDLLSQLAAEE